MQRMALIALLIVIATMDVAIAAPVPDVVLTELGPTRWRVEYQLTSPAKALYFVRAAQGYRQETWRAPGFVIFTGRDGSVRVERRDGGAFTDLVAEIDARYRELPRNYAPFAPFSDGGLLVYTGFFHACADAPCAAGASWTVRLLPSGKRRAVIRGATVRNGVFVDRGDGAMVYVGLSDPIERPDYIAQFDRGLSQGVRRTFEREAPRIIALFDQRLQPLPVRPTFAFSLDPSPRGRDYESRGAALQDQVSIHLLGAGWARPNLQVEHGFLVWYFSHEIAHLYQRIEDGSVTDRFMAEAWVQEGGAEALAALAVAALHPELGSYVEDRTRHAATECENGLAALGRPLDASDAAGAFGNYYACGLAIMMAIDRDVRRDSDGTRDLFDVWRLYLDETRAGTPWTAESFLSAASRSGATSETIRLVSAIAKTRVVAAGNVLSDRLLGAPVSASASR